VSDQVLCVNVHRVGALSDLEMVPREFKRGLWKKFCTSLLQLPVISYGYVTKLGHALTHLVEALHYKPEGRGFDSRWCHWNISIT